jgi:hypothetical protein
MSIALVTTEGFGTASLINTIMDVTLEGYAATMATFAIAFGSVSMGPLLDAQSEIEPFLSAQITMDPQ